MKTENNDLLSTDYQEIKLNKFREVTSFSILFITFFDLKIHLTKEFFGFVKLQQQKIKTRYKWFDDGWSYREYWDDWKYEWKTIKIIS